MQERFGAAELMARKTKLLVKDQIRVVKLQIPVLLRLSYRQLNMLLNTIIMKSAVVYQEISTVQCSYTRTCRNCYLQPSAPCDSSLFCTPFPLWYQPNIWHMGTNE